MFINPKSRMVALAAALAVAIPLLTAISNAQTIDASSDEALKKSMAKIIGDMTPEEQAQFSKALLGFVMSKALEGQISLLELGQMTTDEAGSKVYALLHGKTAEEILALNTNAAKDKRPNPPAEMSTAEKKAEIKRCLMKNVAVVRVAIDRNNYGTSLKLDIHNKLAWPLSAVRISYAVLTDGREVPWDKDETFLSISGGINPDEIRTVSTSLWHLPREIPIEQITVRAAVTDVVDAKNRQFVRDVRLIGASDKLSTEVCNRAS